MFDKYLYYNSNSLAQLINFKMKILIGLWNRLYKAVVAAEGDNYKNSYSKDVFVIWDNSLGLLEEMENYGGSLGQMYFQKLEDTARAGI